MKKRSQDMSQDHKTKYVPLTDRVLLMTTANERQMYDTLIGEFPELKDTVLFYSHDGVGISFKPNNSGSKLRSLLDIYREYLPEINRRWEQRTYEKDLNNYIDG